MFEILFALGFALMAAAVVGAIVVFFCKLFFAVLWLPIHVVGWLAGLIGWLVGGLVCLALLPFAIAGVLLAAVLSIVLNPAVLLLVIGVLAWMLHTRPAREDRRELPEAPHHV